MATIDYKQKIKDYMNSSEVDTLYKSMLNNLFPELKESEDERIRNALKEYFINSFRNNGVAAICGVHIKDILAWLEKQSEQKPADKVEPKFKAGDWVVVSTTEGDRVVQIISIEYFKDCHPCYFTTEGRWFGNRTKARLLTDKDVETITLPESKIIVNQKSDWSEEDESILQGIWDEILANKHDAKEYEWKTYDKFLNWLKSLKEKYTWKPSDEQMENLSRAFNGGTFQTSLLMELYQDLKKLMEEKL